jgi:phosphoribosylformylglycinamidine (FGAM) synthase-like amidotransferase family enzyme
MPHPERACEQSLGSSDGLVIFESAMQWLKTAALVTQA